MTIVALGRRFSLLFDLMRDARGNVLVMLALGLPLLIGALGLGIEVANDYAVKQHNQGIADMAVLSAATVYADDESQPQALAAARAIVAAAGVTADADELTLVPSPRDSSAKALKLTFSTLEPYYFSRLFGLGTTMTVRVTAIAELVDSVAPCILALNQSSSTRGIYVYGGSTLTGSSCDLVANAPIYTEGGSSIVAQKISSASTISHPTYDSSITTTPKDGQIFQNQNATADPLADDTTIATALGLLNTDVSALVPRPSFSGGENASFGYWPTTMTLGGHTLTLNGNTWTAPPGTYNINNLTVGGGLNVVFQGPTTLNVKGSINATGNQLTIGRDSAGNETSGNVVNVGGSITVGGGAGMSISNGSVNVVGTVTNSAPLSMGAGAHYFGVVSVGGGTSFTMGDGPFVTIGDFQVGGASSVVFGATATHWFGHNLTLQGNTTFGAGTYVVEGAFTNNTTGTMQGSNVSFVVKDQWSMGGSATIAITAPTSGSSLGIPGYLLISATSAQTTFTAGSDSIFSGIVYLPNSDLSVNSGGRLSAGSGTDACWTMVVKTITVYGGAKLDATQCSASGSTSSSGLTPRLVR